MKSTLPLSGVLGALAAIVGLGFLASQLIFNNAPTDSGHKVRSNQQAAEIVPDLQGQMPGHEAGKAKSAPKAKVDYSKYYGGSSDLSSAKTPKAEVTKPATAHKRTMVPGAALKNKELSAMTGVQGYEIPKPPAPKVATAPKVAAGEAEQGWLSKMIYGDKVKIAAEKRAKEKAAADLKAKQLAVITGNILDEVLKMPHRKDYKKARDGSRHPKETLLFLGLKPDMTVIEMWPGEGWYSEIIAPVLKKGKGTFYAASWDRQLGTKAIDKALKRYNENYVKKPEIFGTVILTSLSERRFEIGPDNSADLIFSSRNMYSWMRKKMDSAVFNAMYRALKPGGILGIVDHRQAEGTFQDPRAMSGYVQESHVIKLAKQAGFVLVGRSDINANPKDYKKYPRGVFSLPPVLKEGRRHKKKYLAIGESDRMTLKFMKPRSAETTGSAVRP